MDGDPRAADAQDPAGDLLEGRALGVMDSDRPTRFDRVAEEVAVGPELGDGGFHVALPCSRFLHGRIKAQWLYVVKGNQEESLEMALSTTLHDVTPFALRGLTWLALSETGFVLRATATDNLGGGASQSFGTARHGRLPGRSLGRRRGAAGRADLRAHHPQDHPAAGDRPLERRPLLGRWRDLRDHRRAHSHRRAGSGGRGDQSFVDVGVRPGALASPTTCQATTKGRT